MWDMMAGFKIESANLEAAENYEQMANDAAALQRELVGYTREFSRLVNNFYDN